MRIQRRLKSACDQLSLSAWRNHASLVIQNAPSKDSNQPVPMRRLIWISTGRTCPKVRSRRCNSYVLLITSLSMPYLQVLTDIACFRLAHNNTANSKASDSWSGCSTSLLIFIVYLCILFSDWHLRFIPSLSVFIPFMSQVGFVLLHVVSAWQIRVVLVERECPISQLKVASDRYVVPLE